MHNAAPKHSPMPTRTPTTRIESPRESLLYHPITRGPTLLFLPRRSLSSCFLAYIYQPLPTDCSMQSALFTDCKYKYTPVAPISSSSSGHAYPYAIVHAQCELRTPAFASLPEVNSGTVASPGWSNPGVKRGSR